MFCTVCREFYTGETNVFITGTYNLRVCTLPKHAKTDGHQQCLGAKHARERPEEAPLPSLWSTQKVSDKLRSLFNSAYCTAIRGWSFNDFFTLCQLQIKNGVDIGNNYHNGPGVKSMVQSIAHVISQKTVNALKQSRFFSIKADGSTDNSTSEQESVYVRYVANGIPENKFIGLQEVENSTSMGVLAAIDKVLNDRMMVSVETQKNKLVNINLDGAAVNMGKYNGVGAIQKGRIGAHLTVTHCINHGLELAILDLRKDDPYLKEFDSTLKVIIYYYYKNEL